jgi:hypothetical protein
MKRGLLTAAFAIASLGGCVSTGTNFNPAAVDQLKPGMIKAEVIAALGRPNSSSTMANGGEVLVWLHSRGTAWGSGDARSVSLLFDSAGHLVRVLNRTQTQIR